MATQHVRRRRLFVNPDLQGRLLGRFAAQFLLYHTVLWHVMFLYRYLEYRGERLAGAPIQTFSELYGQFALQHYSLVICAVGILPILMWDILMFSHRFAGPVVRLRNSLESLSRGETVAPIRSRQGDLLDGLVAAFNQFLCSRSQRVGQSSPATTTQGAESNGCGCPEEQLLAEIHDLHAGVTQATTDVSTAELVKAQQQILLSTEEKWS